jgi:putative PEP-CTERM system TPR-repeat lipoprotein
MKKTLLVTCITAALLLQGCGKKDSEQHLQDALKFAANNEIPAAIIELKSAIQQQPEDGRLRFELGMIYLKAGDAASAAKELERAAEFKLDSKTIAVPLIQAYFLQGQHQKVASYLSAHPELPLDVQETLKLYHALSLIEASDTDGAKTILAEIANSADPAIKSMVEAQMQVMNGKHEAALQVLSNVNPSHVIYNDALLLKAKLQNVLQQFDASIESFNAYLKQNPGAHLARLILAQSYIAAGKNDEADKEIMKLLKIFPKQPLANYLKAVVEFERKDFQKAKETSEIAIDNGLNSVSSRVLAAIASTQLGLEQQALNHLQAVHTQLGTYPPAQKLYVALKLKFGDTDAARQQILNDANAATDLQLVSATAFQLVKQRSDSAAQELVDKYEKSGKPTADDLTTLGSLKLSIPGMEKQGLAALEEAAKLSPQVEQTQMVLITAYLQQREYAKALELAKSWENDEKLKHSSQNMQAYIAFLQGNNLVAQKHVDAALKIDANHPFTMLLQASLSQAANKVEDAIKTLNSLLEKHPTYLPALEQLYALTRSDNASSALTKAEKLNKDEPTNYQAALLYARMLADQGKHQQGLDLLNATGKVESEWHAFHWALFIEHQRAVQKDAKGAVDSASKWFAQDSADLNSLYTYLRMLILDKQFDKALKMTKEELAKAPDNKVLYGTKIQLLGEMGEYKEALKELDQLSAEEAGKADALFVKGRLLLADNQPEQALVALTDSYQQNQASVTALMIADIYAKTVSEQKAKSFIEQHFNYKPNDSALRIYYGNLLLSTDKDKSTSAYAKVLDTQPDNVAALNNLAWTLFEQKKVDEAFPHIEKAIKLAPENPDVLDTYATILFAKGEQKKALEQFEKSLRIRPENAAVQLNYIDALLKTGDKNTAKTMLDKVKPTDPQSEEKLKALRAQL